MIGKTLRHYLGVLRGAELPQTQTSCAERDLLGEYLSGKKSIVEIGVFEGLTSRVLAAASDSDAIIYGVDPFFPVGLVFHGASDYQALQPGLYFCR